MGPAGRGKAWSQMGRGGALADSKPYTSLDRSPSSNRCEAKARRSGP